MDQWITLDLTDNSTWPEEGSYVEYIIDTHSGHIWVGKFTTIQRSWGITGTFASEQGCCKWGDVTCWRIWDGKL